MGVDQYDPCPCLLVLDHDGEHQCKHDLVPAPVQGKSDSNLADGGDQAADNPNGGE
jgi:hypothetical protein